MDKRLLELGFSEGFIQEASLYPGLFLGRVVSQYKDLYKVATSKSEVFAEISGKLRYSSDKPSDYPAVGDFEMIDREDDKNGNTIIQNILKRKSIFIRRATGTLNEIQVVAANVDIIFICMSLNNDFNLRRLDVKLNNKR